MCQSLDIELYHLFPTIGSPFKRQGVWVAVAREIYTEHHVLSNNRFPRFLRFRRLLGGRGDTHMRSWTTSDGFLSKLAYKSKEYGFGNVWTGSDCFLIRFEQT